MLERLQRPESKEFAQQRLKEHRNEPTYFSGSCADLVSTKNIDSRRGMAKAQFGVRRKNPPKEDRLVKGELYFTQYYSECKSIRLYIYLIGY